jgi:hypothetical protein
MDFYFIMDWMSAAFLATMAIIVIVGVISAKKQDLKNRRKRKKAREA